MLSATKLKEVCEQQKATAKELGQSLARGGFEAKKAAAAVRNWKKGLLKPLPKAEDVRRLADALQVEVGDLTDWRSSYQYA
ncbi:MAG: hypothetical protein ACYTAS_08255, partial [Planctomycetota bacterium]